MNTSSQPGILGIIWRSLLAGIGYVLAVTVADMLTRLFGLSAPVMPAALGAVSPAQLLINLFLAGIVIGAVLGPLCLNLPISFWRRAGLLFYLVYGINSLLIVVESVFFMITPPSLHLYTLIANAISAAGIALLLALLFRSQDSGLALGTAVREALAQRSWFSNLWRFGLAGFLYLPIFFLFGILAQPFVSIYYEDPSYGITQLFSVPGPEVIFPLELGRGYLFVLLVYPLIAVLGRSMGRWRQAFWTGLVIAALSVWVPMLIASFFPLTFRLAHGVEVTLDSFLHAAFIVWLLGVDLSGSPAN